ncbi:MAG: MupA/Atu3671 family FMN-dependent luciferase-like monooxygenase, partial [Blastocatellia bacterium]
MDNLSDGRVGVSFASGYRPDDFVFSPESYENRRDLVISGIEMIHRLWSGATVKAPAGSGSIADVKLFPMPMQPALPTWLTSNSLDTCMKAGERGFGLLTNLQDQTLEEMARKVTLYREALSRNGHGKGHVTVLLHTYVATDLASAEEFARPALYKYLRTFFSLLRNVIESQGRNLDFDSLTPTEMNYLLSTAYERYVASSSLIGTVSSCQPMVDRLIEVGVDEIGCLVDFGIPGEQVLQSLRQLNSLRMAYSSDGTISHPRTTEVCVATTLGETRHHVDESTPAASTRSITQSSAEACPAGEAGDASSVRAFERTLQIPLTDAQKRLWIVAQMGDIPSRAFNESTTLKIRGGLDVSAMCMALQGVVDRHEALRTTFDLLGEYQEVSSRVEIETPFVDLSPLEEADRDLGAAEWLSGQAGQPFDFSKGNLLRTSIAKLSEKSYMLAFTVHHILVDGWSLNVLLRELRELYSAARKGVSAR